VAKRFPGAAGAAVDDVSLAIERGAFFALLGPSGCGKTTLLRLLAGFETPDRGTIAIDGIDMGGVPPYRRPVNMMFQSYALFPHLTVAANVAFGLRQERLGRAAIDGRVAAMLDLMQIGQLAGRKPDRLSGGEKQRVALARALVKEPKLLLLDEPLAALDRKLREETRFELKNLHRRVGITFLLVTHDQEEAMSMASRLAVMKDGRIEQEGAPDFLYENPANRFVAGFLGAINLFEGRVTGAEQELLLIESEAGPLAVEHAALAVGTAVAIAVRPEKIRLVRENGAGGRNMLAGKIRAIAYRGEASTYEIELPRGQVVRATLGNSGGPGAGLGQGQPVRLSFDPAAARVLEG